MIDLSNFNQEIVEKINKNRFTYSQVAERIEISLSSMSRYIAGKLSMPASARVRLTQFFEIIELKARIAELEEQLHIPSALETHNPLVDTTTSFDESTEPQ